MIWKCKCLMPIKRVYLELQRGDVLLAAKKFNEAEYYFHNHHGHQNLQLWQLMHIILKIIMVMQFLS